MEKTVQAAQDGDRGNEEEKEARNLEQDRGKAPGRVDTKEESAQGAEEQPSNDSHDGPSRNYARHWFILSERQSWQPAFLPVPTFPIRVPAPAIPGHGQRRTS